MPLQQNFNLLPLRPQVSSSLNRSHIYLFSLSGLNGYFNPMKVNFCFFPPSPFFLPLEKVVSKVVWVQLRGRAKGSAVCRKRYILGLLLHFFISSFVKIYFCVHCTLFNILVQLDRYIFNRYGNSWGIKVYNQESGDNYSKKTKQNKNLDSEAKETPDWEDTSYIYAHMVGRKTLVRIQSPNHDHQPLIYQTSQNCVLLKRAEQRTVWQSPSFPVWGAGGNRTKVLRYYPHLSHRRGFQALFTTLSPLIAWLTNTLYTPLSPESLFLSPNPQRKNSRFLQ